MATQSFGEPIARREDPRLVAGDGRFLDDLGAGALAAAFVRSPHARARVVDVDASGALEVDGLVAVYTYEDLDGPVAEPLPLLIPHPSLHAPRTAYLRDHPDPDADEAREAIGGNLCRCTGYQNIVASVLRAAELVHRGPEEAP